MFIVSISLWQHLSFMLHTQFFTSLLSMYYTIFNYCNFSILILVLLKFILHNRLQWLLRDWYDEIIKKTSENINVKGFPLHHLLYVLANFSIKSSFFLVPKLITMHTNRKENLLYFLKDTNYLHCWWKTIISLYYTWTVMVTFAASDYIENVI